jgi:hypothetical protein
MTTTTSTTTALAALGAEALRQRLDELRGLGNVYATCAEPPPPELAEEFARVQAELVRRASGAQRAAR